MIFARTRRTDHGYVRREIQFVGVMVGLLALVALSNLLLMLLAKILQPVNNRPYDMCKKRLC